ncbi:hypothetical protein H8B06_18030 [Sphingobacterium sp. DN00404]|uniref:Uncharacterized protein n=1 Tax=Sphingobacterium micropteri TaxID=2763501 RepID=A0ABR7YTX1_9SPHI|nr:hypothetical protein [Sphingobacterium micropteri]MBD1434730.1 hypothetical protein [Sphingobacterium micropteri]
MYRRRSCRGRQTARDVRRLSALPRWPVNAHIGATASLRGAASDQIPTASRSRGTAKRRESVPLGRFPVYSQRRQIALSAHRLTFLTLSCNAR